MPGKANRKNSKSPAGNSGLTTETTSLEHNPDQTTSPNASSVAAQQLPRHETQAKESDAAIKAFEDLFETSNEQDDKAPSPRQSNDQTMNDGTEEDDAFLLPESQNFSHGTAEHFTEVLRFNGLRWRHELKRRVRNDPTLQEFLVWVNNRPSPMDEPTRPLGQMLHDIKDLRSEADRIIDMGDGYVQMPSATFERHVYPSAFLRSYLASMGDTEALTGGIESSFLYSFHMQCQALPAERTTLDLQVLRASSLHATDDLMGQVTDSSEIVSGLSLNMTNTLDKLEEECELPNYRTLQNWSRQEVEARSSTVRATLKLYREQAQRDYQMLRVAKEKSIVLAQLTNAQAIENLVLNSRILKMVQDKETQVRTTVGADLKAATDKYKDAMWTVTQNTIAKLEAQYGQVLETITPYDTDDAMRLLDKQTELLVSLEYANSMLVSENSKLRVHLSFMPIRYRQEVEKMQQTDNQVYREQRKIPKNFSPQDSDNHAGKLKLVEAPRAHEMTRRYLHDCEYANIGEIRAGVVEAAKLKKNLYMNRIPRRTEDINAPPLLPTKEAAPRPESGKGKAPLRASLHNADQGPPTRRKLEDRDTPGRTPLDNRLVQRNQSQSRNSSQTRHYDSDGPCNLDDYVSRSRDTRPSDARDRFNNSSHDKSTSSDHSRDPRPRESEFSRNRDPRERDKQRYRPRSPTRDRGGKGKGGKQPRLDSPFPKYCETHIEILTRDSALRHLGIEKPLTPPTEEEAASISDEDLVSLLRKPALGQYDRANHGIICGQLRDMYIDASIGIEMTYGRDQPSVWLDIHGQTIPPEDVDEIPLKYYMPPEKDQVILGNYWWVVRLRPNSSAKRYEYMPNKMYPYSRVVFDFAQLRTLTLSANRWYYEAPIEKTLASCLYPYHQYCPGLDVDFRRCNIKLQLNRLQYMEETKEPPKNPQCLNPIKREDKKREHNDSVQLLVDVGAIRDSSAACLEEYLTELENHQRDVQRYLKTNPFATARKFLLLQDQRMTAIVKAVKNVLKPPTQHGGFVNNLADINMHEMDDNELMNGDNDDDVDLPEGRSPSHGDTSPSPTPTIEHSRIQYVQLPLPKNQGRNDLNQDRQSGGRGGNHR